MRHDPCVWPHRRFVASLPPHQPSTLVHSSAFLGTAIPCWNRVRILTLPHKLFTGGLAFSTSNEHLRELFAAASDVESAEVVMDRDTGRSRDFAFIESA
jgi:RNA recognition motif. (a.k.a. RRM, RBD, or RNP domain)